jgi:hypothetical protein
MGPSVVNSAIADHDPYKAAKIISELTPEERQASVFAAPDCAKVQAAV